MSLAFRNRYLDRLVANSTNHHRDNFAAYRYPARPETRVDVPACQRWTQFILDHTDEFESARDVFEDEASRRIFDDVLQFNSLGHLRVRHARQGSRYRAFLEALPGAVLERGIPEMPEKSVHAVPGSDLRVASGPGFLINIVHGRQYFFERDGVRIQPEPGDVMLDCGGGLGDTAIYFADHVGSAGRVFTFEFVARNLAVFRRNLALNPRVADRIRCVERAVGARTGDVVRYDDRGVSTRLGDAGACEAETVRLDDFAEREGLERVDLIKMDVEGAEREALTGAARILRTYAPKLAISAYHRLDDLYELPRRIREIHPGYRFWLDHHTIHREETVLYGLVEG